MVTKIKLKKCLNVLEILYFLNEVIISSVILNNAFCKTSLIR